ncbi:MAG: glycosyltransferase family 2 protein, partial [Mycoplasma sp.]|nr:glycosyltransferase family 2 protein [Mycoplasma sp.]
MDVSIIIVNYNTKELTVNCINSIYKHTKNVDFEVIVVDNASSDGSKECFGAFPGIIYIYSHENLGFGKANNLGVQVSRGKYLFFLNSDTLLINNTVKILCDTYKRIPNAGCLGVRLIDGDQNYIHSSESFPLFKRQLIDLFKISKKDSYLRKELSRYTGGTIEVDYVTGADLFVDKSLFIEFGM